MNPDRYPLLILDTSQEVVSRLTMEDLQYSVRDTTLKSYSNIAKAISNELDNTNMSKSRMKLWSDLATYWPGLADAIKAVVQVHESEKI